MEAINVIGGGVIAFGAITSRWVYYGRERQAWRLAQARGVTMLRVVPPYNRLGVSVRCEVWTLLGAFLGGLIGFSIGWAYLGSVGLGAVLGSVGAALFGWRYRVVTSIIVAC